MPPENNKFKAPVLPDVHVKPHKPLTITRAMLREEELRKEVYFRSAQAIVVLCDFNSLHSAHTCPIPVPLSESDVEYFKRMEPVVKQFYVHVARRVRAIRLVSTVLEVTLNDGTRSYYAIQPN